MYYAIVVATMLVLPALSVAIQASAQGFSFDPLLVAKWFTFWAVGVRLFLAGLRQTIQPRYTANVILGLKSEECLMLVRELGFANLALGSVGLLSLPLPGWLPAAALAGGIFYALAGLGHVFSSDRNRLETVAMVSDLMAGALLICLVVAISGFSRS
jgi:hypothetical protein